MDVVTIYVLIIGLVMALLRQLKGAQVNNVREFLKNIIVTVLVALMVFYTIGWQPLMIIGLAYFADDVFVAFLERYDKTEMESWITKTVDPPNTE